MNSVIENLRAVSRKCLDHSDDQLRWIGRSLDKFLAHRCQSVDEALGLNFPRGGVPWWREEEIRNRDAALRELAARHLPMMSVSAQARRIRVLSLRYAASAWRFDSARDAMPPHYKGSIHEWLWRAFVSRAPMPIGERQLRHLLPAVCLAGRQPRSIKELRVAGNHIAAVRRDSCHNPGLANSSRCPDV